MPPTRAPTDTESFTITLPRQALAMIEKLKDVGLYGTNRGEICRALILARLEDVIAKGVLRAE